MDDSPAPSKPASPNAATPPPPTPTADNGPAFDPKQLNRIANWETPLALLAACLDPVGNRLYGAGFDGWLYWVDLAADPPKADKPQDAKTPAQKMPWRLHENYVAGLVLHERTLISASYDRTLAWWNVETGERLRTVDAHEGWVRKLALSHDRAHLASIGDDMRLRLWNPQSGENVATLAGQHSERTPEGFTSALYALAAHPTASLFATADRVGEIRVWDATQRKSVAAFRAADFYTYDPQKRARSIGGIRALGFSPDGSQLAVAGIGQVTNVDGFVGPCRLEIWDWPNQRRERAAQGKHQAILNHVKYGPVAPWITTAGGGDGGGIIGFWNTSATEPQHLAKPTGHVHQFVWSHDGRRLFTVGHGGFQRWDVNAPEKPTAAQPGG